MEESTSGDYWALVLAGGDGTRLQELTRAIAGTPIPKQYCRIMGDRSLLEVTLARAQYFAPHERTLVIVNRDHLNFACEQLRALPPQNVLVQPCNRDTGPGLTFSLLHLARYHPGATVAVFPCDHYVSDDLAFIAHVQRATRIVNQLPEKVVLLGICPDCPEPGYGYIEPAQPLQTLPDASTAYHVAAFWEKPTAGLAQKITTRGGLWNSFVMVFQLERMLKLLQHMMPTYFEQMRVFCHHPGAIAAGYRELIPWNFSSHFLAHIPQHLVVLRVDDVAWSDWGTPESIERTFATLKQVPPWRARKPDPAAA